MKSTVRSLLRFVAVGLLAGLGGLIIGGAGSVIAAEEIRLIIGGPLLFDFSVDSLETFAETGEINEDLRLATRFLDDTALTFLRETLQRPIPLDVVQTDNLAYSTLGQDLLENFGKVFRVTPTLNGGKGLRGALIIAAAQAPEEGWTIVDVLQQFPSETIDVRLEDLLALRRSLTTYTRYNSAAISAIQSQSATESTQQAPLPETTALSQPGPYAHSRNTFTLTNEALRQTNEALEINYEFTVQSYIPQGLSAPAPIIIISHGFGDVQDSFSFIAEHLASHGYAVMLPNHVGSDLGLRQNFLEGFVNTILSPTEYISRPQEVSFLLDELEARVANSPEWAEALDMNRVGMVGDSLGGATALALAGAEIDYNRLADLCSEETVNINMALYLQCQARFLPPQNRQLRDPRIQAVMVSHPIGGGLYGPEGYGQINIPLMMFSGSNDIVSPTTEEQIHPFIWTGSDEKYLGLLTEGTHFTVKPGREGITGFITLFTGENRDLGSHYYKAFNVAFWNTYLREQSEFRPYLSARYGEQISEGEPLALDVISALTPEMLIASYGQEPPVPIVPAASEIAAQPRRAESVLLEIARTGVLKVALRQDAAPFGFVDSESNWRGYCRAFAEDLRDRVQKELVAQKLGPQIELGLVEFSSTLDNRFSLVQDEVVHVECGPNTIRNDIEGVAFSVPLLVSGTQFLVKRSQIDLNDPNARLAGVRVAILPNTTTEQFIDDTFPQANRVPFPGPSGRRDAVRALAAGDVDVFASDGILSISEALRQNLPIDNYVLVPEVPLTCEFYGLVLPENSPDWQRFVNDFLEETHTERLNREVPSALLEGQIETLDLCLNRASNQ